MRHRAVRRNALLTLGASVALVALASLTPPSLFEGTDWLQLHLPNRAYMVEVLRSGGLPLWNPYVALGRPFMADVETAVLYPPNWIHVLMDPSTALLILMIAHYVLGLLGMLALGTELGLARWTAWLAGACFLWSAPLVAPLSSGQVPYAQGLCYLPLLFLLALRLQDAFSVARLAALAGALALQLLCGHPQIAWISWVGIAAFVLGRGLPPSTRPVRTVALGLLGFAAALAAAFALAAPMLLPLTELVSQGNRSAPSLSFASAGTMEWWQWTSLAVPDGGRRAFYWTNNMYAGLLPPVLGLAGLAIPRDRTARGLVATALVGGLLASGTRTPAFVVLYHLLPGLSSFHLHARAGLLVVFALIVGAALFLSRAQLTRRSISLLAVGAVLAPLGALAFHALGPMAGAPREPFPTDRLLLGATLALVAGLSIRFRGGPRAVLLRAGLAVLVLAELGASLGPARRAWRSPVVTVGERPLFDGLLRAGLYGKTGVPPRIAVPPWSVRSNAALFYKWSSVAGYGSLTLDRVWVFLHEDLGLTPPPDENTYPSRHIYDHGPFPYDSMNLAAGWRVNPGPSSPGPATGPPLFLPWQPPPGRPVLRRPEDPRVYVATSTQRVQHWREAVALMASGHDFHETPLVETERGLVPAAPAAAGEPGAGRAEIIAFEPERVLVDVETSIPALLVLAEAWYPGWSARIDDSPAPCFPANAWMRAVPVPEGRHQVDLRFRSRWLWPGVGLSLLAAAALSLLMVRERRAAARWAPDDARRQAQ